MFRFRPTGLTLCGCFPKASTFNRPPAPTHKKPYSSTIPHTKSASSSCRRVIARTTAIPKPRTERGEPPSYSSITTMVVPRPALKALSTLPRPSYISPSRLLTNATVRSMHSTYFTSQPATRQSIWQGLGWAFGGLSKRPVAVSLEATTLEQSRGMKVRSSVKKLCDGCKVRSHSILKLRATALLQRRCRLQSVMDESRPTLLVSPFLSSVRYNVSDELTC